jgi:hypothetical protein
VGSLREGQLLSYDLKGNANKVWASNVRIVANEQMGQGMPPEFAYAMQQQQAMRQQDPYMMQNMYDF